MREFKVIGFCFLFGIFVLGLLVFQSWYFNGVTGFVISPDEGSNNIFSERVEDGDFGGVEVVVNINSPSNGEVFEVGEGFFLDYDYFLDIGITESDRAYNFDSCWYSLDKGKNNLSLEDCASKEISIPNEGKYEIFVYVLEGMSLIEGVDSVLIEVKKNDSVELNNTANSPGGGSGGSGGGVESKEFYDLEFTSLPEFTMRRGEVREASFSARNVGFLTLSNCVVSAGDQFTGLVNFDGGNIFPVGRNVEVNFNVELPKDFESGNFNVRLLVNCLAKDFESSFDLEVLPGDLDLTIINSRREGRNYVVDYNIVELSGVDQDVQMVYFLSDGVERLFENQENFLVPARATLQRTLEIELPPRIEGEHSLIIELDSESFSIKKEEKVVLSSSGFTGFAIFEQGNVSKIGLVVLILGAIVGFFVVRFFNKKLSHEKFSVFGRVRKHFIKLHVRE